MKLLRKGFAIAVALLVGMSALRAQVDSIDYLELSLEQLMNIEITTASKKTETNFESPLSSSVITYDEILKSGVTSIPEAMRLIPGVIVREQSNGVYDVQLRGFDYVASGSLPYSTNSITLVLIDGRPVFRDFQGGTYWESLPIELVDVDRIEVIRGPSSSMYGANAAAGVINIITKRLRKNDDNKHYCTANLQKGNNNTNLMSVNAGMRANKFSVGFSGNYSQRNKTDNLYYDMKRQSYVVLDSIQGRAKGTYAFAKDKNTRYPNPAQSLDKYGINSYLNYAVNEKVNFDLSFGLQKSEVQKAYVDATYTPLTTERSETEFVNFKSDLYGLNLQASHLRGYQNTLGVAGWEYTFYNTDLNLEYNIELLDKKLIVRPGVNYRESLYNDSLSQRTFGYGFINNNEAKLTTMAGMLRFDYTPIDPLRFIASLRYDKYNYPDKG